MFATENSYVVRFCSFVRILTRLAHDIVDSRDATSSPEVVLHTMEASPTQIQSQTELEHSRPRVFDGQTVINTQDALHLHEDLDTLMTMWENGTNAFTGFSRTNDLMVFDDFSPNVDKGLWDHYNLTGDIHADRVQETELLHQEEL